MARVTATPPSTSSAAGSGDAARTYHELRAPSARRPWDEPIDSPRVVQGFVPNDFDRWPQPAAVYPPDLPTTPLRRELPASTVAATDVLAGAAGVAGEASLDLPALARLLYLSAGVVRVLAPARPAPDALPGGGLGRGAVPARRVPRRARRQGCPTGCTGTTRSGTRSCRSGRPPTTASRRWWSRACPGARAGGTPSAATGTCTGTPARCSRRTRRSRSRPACPGGCTSSSRTPPCRSWSAPTGCTRSRWRWWRSRTGRPPRPPAARPRPRCPTRRSPSSRWSRPRSTRATSGCWVPLSPSWSRSTIGSSRRSRRPPRSTT